MHVIVPFASDASEPCGHVLGDLALPNLTRVLTSFAEVDRDDADASSFSPPHERALARARGWHGDDGALPFAAHAAHADGIATDDNDNDNDNDNDKAWALLTPAHWLLGREDATLLDPDLLALSDAESQSLLASVDELFATEGFELSFGSAGRWYAANDGFDGLATPSLDRVIGRNIGPWLVESARREAVRSGTTRRDDKDARGAVMGSGRSADIGSGRKAGIRALVGRLQSEAQLVFHAHPVNEEREARGQPTINSFWLSGCGRRQPAVDDAALDVASALRTPLLAGDWAAWAEAWRALDAGPIARLGDAARDDGNVALTLCGERAWTRFEPRRRPFWQRLRSAVAPADAARVLASLSAPSLSPSTPTLSQSAPTLSQSAPTLSQSAPTLSQSAPTPLLSASTLSQSADVPSPP